jgi:hypothetical protein
MIKKIVSGGQRGADQGGLDAGYCCDIETGGWAPKGYLTLDGYTPNLSLFSVKEHNSPYYAPRTFANVKDSDGTIRFAYDFNTKGELCTLKAINQYKKPYFDVDLNKEITNEIINDIIDWIRVNKIEILNVAGNAGNTKDKSLDIHFKVRDCLIKVLKRLSV